MSVRIARLLTCFACVVLSVSSCSLSKSSDVKSAVAPSSVAPSEVGAECPGVPTTSVDAVAKNLSFRPSESLRRNSDVVTNVECDGRNDKRLLVFYSHYGENLKGRTSTSCQAPIGPRSPVARSPSRELWALKVRFSSEMTVGVAQSSHAATPSFSSPSTRGKN